MGTNEWTDHAEVNFDSLKISDIRMILIIISYRPLTELTGDTTLIGFDIPNDLNECLKM